MVILVSGGAGFIGSHLVDRLIIDNKVIVADKLVYGDNNIRHLYDNRNFTFINCDLSDMNQVLKIFDTYKIDVVYHLAANSDIQKGGIEPNIDFYDTFLTTRNILDAMRKYNIKKLFFSSTSAVYGDKKDEILTENTGDLRPISYYGGAKFASEALISSYVSMCDMSAVIFRFPNVIGPRLTHGVVYDFIKKLQINNKELNILGDGRQCKPYIYVLDLVDAICKLTQNIKLGLDIYNISVIGDGTSVLKIAEFVCEEMNLKNVIFTFTGGSVGWKGDVAKFKYDIDKVLATGWKPKHTSDETVRQTIKDYLANEGY